jgi:hypothetical protein
MNASGWKALAVVATSLVAIFPVCAADAPTREIVEKVMKGNWDKVQSGSTPRSVLTLNEVRFGKPYSATAQEVQVEGIPKGASVTPVVVDFTVRTYYTGEIQAVRRVREATVYKNKMDDWSIMTGSAKGQDTTTREPAK